VLDQQAWWVAMSPDARAPLAAQWAGLFAYNCGLTANRKTKLTGTLLWPAERTDSYQFGALHCAALLAAGEQLDRPCTD